MLKYDTKSGHTSLPRGRSGAAPFNTNNTKPTVNTDSKHTDNKHTDSTHSDSKYTDSKHTDSKNTEKQHVGNTSNRQTKTHPWHAIRASAVADIQHARNIFAGSKTKNMPVGSQTQNMLVGSKTQRFVAVR